MTPRPVLIVLPSLSRGGAERHSVWLATEVDRDRWQPHVLAFADGPLREELSAAGIPVEVVAMSGGAKAVPAAAAAVRRSIATLQPALVTGQHIVVETAIRLALRGRRIPYLAWKHTYGNVGRRGLRERLFEQVTGGAVTRYGAVCQTQVRFLTDDLGLAPDKISVVANAVPVPEEMPGRSSSTRPIVLMTAAMRTDKDHQLVLRAWPEVLKRHPAALLRLAGDGPVRADLERLTTELGITSAVQFLGIRSDVDAQLADAHLLVLSSYAVECFPYAVLEAMAAGRGVVSTNVAGLPELVDDGVTGRLVNPHDSAALSAAMSEGLDDGFTGDARWGAAGWRRVRDVFPFADWSLRIADLFDITATSRSPRRTFT